jgi:type I restriction enzyme S subunit
MSDSISEANGSSWPTIPLGEIAEVKLGKMLDKAKHRTGRRLPYLRNINVRWGTVDTSDLLEMNFDDDELDRFGLKKGDVLVCEGGEPGRAAVWNDSIPNIKYQKAIHRIRFKERYEPRLLIYLLELLAKTGRLERRFTGSTIKHFTREAIVQLPIPVPPFDEQQLIVAEIEKQFTRLDAGVASLKRVQTELKRYRASVLKAACEGRLVPTEAEFARKENRSYETAEQLLQRILQERRERWNRNGKYKQPAALNLTELPPLPEGWTWCMSDTVFIFVTSGSRGWAKYYSEAGPVFLRIGNLNHEDIRLDLRDIQRVRPPKGAEGTRTTVKANDILISITADVGMVGLVPDDLGEAYINQHVALARPHFLINAKYLAYYLSASEGGWKKLKKLQRGATKVGLGLDDIRSVPIPLPPLIEQQHIVAEVERRLSLIEELEIAANDNLKRTVGLRRSVLRQAFEARLTRFNNSR